MKKFLLGLLLLVLVLGGIFYRQILDTVDFYQYQQANKDVFTEAIINWKEMPFTSTGSSGTANDAITFGPLTFPISFPATKKEGPDTAFALGSTESITITNSNAVADFFEIHDFFTDDKKAICAFLSQTSGRGACTSNYNLYRAFLKLDQTDIHVFSSISDKELYNQLMTIRADVLRSMLRNNSTASVSGFETSNVRGFLFTLDKNNYIAHLFDSQDKMYEITFTNLSQSDVAFVLSNITTSKNDTI